MSMDSNLVLVSFGISPQVEVEFNRFYHRSFLPALLKQSPEIDRIIRYEEFTPGGSLRWYNKPFLTFYQLAPAVEVEQVEQIFSREAVGDLVKEFGQWKTNHLVDFSRVTYSPRWLHKRSRSYLNSFTGPLFVWQHEANADKEDEFEQWYENDYLPLQIAEIPTWSGARRFYCKDRTPVRYLTVFETDNEVTLTRSMTDLRSPQRLSENMLWQKRAEEAIAWQDAATFRPIFVL